MFAFDQATLPQLTTRKALIIVDLQDDFLSPDGALPVRQPKGFVDRTVQLAAAFRATGDVVWVQSRFEGVRPVSPEEIIVTDAVPRSTRPGSRVRRRRPSIGPPDGLGDDTDRPPDQEAFLSHEEPDCVKPSSPGSAMPATVKEAVQKNDIVLTKSHYSAFQATHLLRMLRAKMVIEVYICGSLANVGVYATAIDAAGHGMAITVVEDCCGYRSENRQAAAVSQLIDLTGCEIASYDEVLETIQPQPEAAAATAKVAEPTSTSSRPGQPPFQGDTVTGRSSASPDIVRPMTGLRLASGSPSPATTGSSSSSSSSTGAAVSTPTHDDLQLQQKSSKLREATGVSEADDPEPRHVDVLNLGGESDKVQGDSISSDHLPLDQATDPSLNKEDSPKPVRGPLPQPDIQRPPNSGEAVSASAPILAAATTGRDSDGSDASAPLSRSETDEKTTAQKGLCDGDTDVIEDFLPPSLEDGIFERLRDEIRWQRMSHQGGEVPRLVAVQGQLAEDGSIPVYRHPADESPPLLPFSPTVLAIKAETEKLLGHPLNHVLIQHYRNGNDYISEHSDKTLDIVRGSYIANVSLGAQRTMVLRTKRLDKDPSRTGSPAPDASSKRSIQRARLPHNSLCRMGLRTNMKWLHSIRQDKRPDRDKSPAELAYSGARISLTFRHIGTFLNRDETLIWGQGATGKSRDEAHAVINGQTPEAIKMLQGFGTENHSSTFDWDAYYGKGFDVLHMSQAPRLFASADPIVNMRVQLMLAELGISCAKGIMAPNPGETGASPESKGSPLRVSSVPIKYIDNDTDKSVVHGELAIMLYLEASQAQSKTGGISPPLAELARRFTRFQQGLVLLDQWRQLRAGQEQSRVIDSLKQELAPWEVYAKADDPFLAGSTPSLPDFAVWPVLHAMVEELGPEVLGGLTNLATYYSTMLGRKSTSKVLGKAISQSKD